MREARTVRTTKGTEEDNIIVQGIQGSKYAMGYFGYAYYSENEDSIKGLEIEGHESDGCSPPSPETAQDGSYPMSRPLFIYASKQSLNEKPQVEEFVRYYIENSSSDLVSEVGYVPASESLVEENLSTLDDATGGK